MRIKTGWLWLICTLLLSACSPETNIDKTSSEEVTELASTEESQSDEASPSEDGEVKTIRIRSIGDILVHNTVYEDARTAEGYDFNHMFDGVRQYLENADITTANLEVIAAGNVYGPSTYPSFSSPPEILDALQNAGIDIVNNATNHTLDYGADGALVSIDELQARDLMYFGSFDSWEDYNTPRIIEVNGIKVGFLSYANDANGNYIPEDEAYLLSQIDLELIPLEVAALNEIVDFSIVNFQMGDEYERFPNEWQLSVMQITRDAGANFILGGHPHYVQPIIQYNESQAAWFSHGNFLSGQYEIPTKVGGITEMTVEQDAAGDIRIVGFRFMPTFNFGMPETPVYSIVPLADAEEYGLSDADAIFAELVERMRYYTNQVEVVEYLD